MEEIKKPFTTSIDGLRTIEKKYVETVIRIPTLQQPFDRIS